MSKRIEQLFLAYLEGRISSQDEKFLLEWLKNNPEAVKDYNEFRRIWNMSKMLARLTNEDLEKRWQEIIREIESSPVRRLSPVQRFFYWAPRVAAVFLFGAALSFFVAYLVFNKPTQNLAFQEINTPAGAKSKITLPDGTVVWLNASSNLKYSSDFGKKGREVELEGEAFFDVETDSSKIFMVRTSELNIKAYGTSFNVKSYPEEGTIETTLLEGKVGVVRDGLNVKENEVLLEPNQRVVYFRKNKPVEETIDAQIEKQATETIKTQKTNKLTYLISKGIDTREFTSWKDGTLFITSESLSELAIKLERKYDVKIHFETEALKKLKFTGSLENETVEQVIEAIGIAAHIDYEIEDRDIWLKEKN